MSKALKAGLVPNDRNPLTLEYVKNWTDTIDARWVAERCKHYGTECSNTTCQDLGTMVFITLYSCTFLCDACYSKIQTDDEEGDDLTKVHRLILSDRADIAIYDQFTQRSIQRLNSLTNGEMRQLSTVQLRNMKLLDEQEKDAEFRARMKIRRRARKIGARPGLPAMVAFEAEVIQGEKWMAVEFDSRQSIGDVIVPPVGSIRKEFLPERDALPNNETGLDLEGLF